MPLYLDTRGNTNLAVGVCGRCKLKRPIVALVSDPNVPGLRVCGDKGARGCVDKFDPYRLPARKPESITVRYPRPDLPLDSFGDTVTVQGIPVTVGGVTVTVS